MIQRLLSNNSFNRFVFSNIKFFFPDYPMEWLSDELETSYVVHNSIQHIPRLGILILVKTTYRIKLWQWSGKHKTSTGIFWQVPWYALGYTLRYVLPLVVFLSSRKDVWCFEFSNLVKAKDISAGIHERPTFGRSGILGLCWYIPGGSFIFIISYIQWNDLW